MHPAACSAIWANRRMRFKVNVFSYSFIFHAIHAAYPFACVCNMHTYMT